MIILKMAWRNIWRNKLRSMAIMFAVALGLLAGIFAAALVNGMMHSRFENFIENQISHLQVHHHDFVGQQEVYQTTGAPLSVLDDLLNEPMVRAATVRTKVQSMIASATYTGGVQLLGVDPQNEQRTTAFQENLVSGEFLKQSGGNEILIGQSLAKKMRVSEGSRLVLTFQDKENNMVSAAFVVRGIFETGYTRYDESVAMVNLTYLNKQIDIGDTFHELAVLIHDIEQIDRAAAMLSTYFPELHVRKWNEVSPELELIVEAGDTFAYIFVIVILMGLAFGLLNTMLMAVYERTREIGMLMAIGMNKKRLFSLILIETMALSFVGASLGLIGGAALVYFTNRGGIDLSAADDVMKEIGFDPMVYPQLNPEFFGVLLTLVLITALVAAIYPSLRAMRLNPAESVKR